MQIDRPSGQVRIVRPSATRATLALSFVVALFSLALVTQAGAVLRPSKPKPPTKQQIQSELRTLSSEAGKESKATFQITYEYKNSSSTGTVTLEQKPPDELFNIGSGEVIFNGKKTYYCSLATTLKTCFTYGSLSVNPLAATLHVYDSSLYIASMKGWEDVVASGIAGYSVSFSSAKFAGLSAECVSWSYHGASDKYCVANNGLLVYTGGTAAGSKTTFTFTLTKYSATVASSSFQPPKGAKLYSAP